MGLSDEQLATIQTTNQVVSSLSFLGSLGIIALYLKYPQLQNFSNALVLCQATAELFYSISNFIGNPTDGSAACYIQAGMQSYFILSAVFWNGILSYVIHNAVNYPEKILGISKKMPRYHGYCWGIPFIATLLPAATLSYGNSVGWCWIKSSQAGSFWRFFQFYAPLWCVMGYNVKVFISIRKTLAGVKGLVTDNSLVFFPMILVFCWFFASINRIQNIAQPDNPKYPLFMLQVLFGNLQGFCHFLAYISTPPAFWALASTFGYTPPPSLSADLAGEFIDPSDGKSEEKALSRHILEGNENGEKDEKGESLNKSETDTKDDSVTRTRKLSGLDQLMDVSSIIRGAYLKELGIYQFIGVGTTSPVQKVYGILKEHKRLESKKDLEVDDAKDDNNHKTTRTGAYLTLMKAFVGIGILAIPGAYAQAGYILSTIFMILIAVVSYYCSILLISCKDTLLEEENMASPGGEPATTKMITFQEVGYRIMGNRGKSLVEAGIVTVQVSFVCAYFLFIGEQVSNVVNKQGFFNSKIFFTLLSTVLSVPLVWIKSLKLLLPAALFSDVIILFGLSVIFAYDFIQIDKVHESVEAFRWSGLPLFFGIAVFAFEGINMVLPVEQSMKNPKQFPAVLRQVIFHLCIAMILIGALSYSAFGVHTENPIVNSLPSNNLIKTVQIMYSIALFCTVPVQLFPAVAILESYPYFKKYFGENLYIHRFLVVVFVGAIASVVPNFGLFLNVVGAVGGTAVAFIIPSLFYMKQTKNFKAWQPIGALVFGIIGGFIALVMSIVEFTK